MTSYAINHEAIIRDIKEEVVKNINLKFNNSIRIYHRPKHENLFC